MPNRKLDAVRGYVEWESLTEASRMEILLNIMPHLTDKERLLCLNQLRYVSRQQAAQMLDVSEATIIRLGRAERAVRGSKSKRIILPTYQLPVDGIDENGRLRATKPKTLYRLADLDRIPVKTRS